MRRKKLIVAVGLVLILAIAIIKSTDVNAPLFKSDRSESSAEQKDAFDKKMYSQSKPSSPWVVVNKNRPISAAYVPSDLRQPKVNLRSPGSSEMLLRDDAAASLEKLSKSAKKDGLSLMLVSGYRSYGLQSQVYNSNVSREGQVNADKTSARPGFSEHQTGWAADLGRPDGYCQLQACFGSTKEGKWLAKNAYKHGFIIRYEQDTKAIVGYTYEPWHLRYVGKALAQEINKSGQTLEEFFKLQPAPSY